MRRERGFNLAEAMVALAVLAILTSIAVPGMADFVRGWQVRGLAESMRDGLQKARMEAMRRNQPMTFWMVSPATTSSPDASCQRSSASGAWVVSVDDPSGSCNSAPSATENPRLFEKYGPGRTAVTVAGVATDGSAADAVAFNAFGQAVTDAGRLACIDLSHTEGKVRELRVEITASGSIRLCDRSVAAPDVRACSNPAPCADAT